MVRYVFKTKDRQGEFINTEYDGKSPKNGWNHWQHWDKKRVEQWAKDKNLTGWIERVVY
jgi:hypothetical protein